MFINVFFETSNTKNHLSDDHVKSPTTHLTTILIMVSKKVRGSSVSTNNSQNR